MVKQLLVVGYRGRSSDVNNTTRR